MIRIFLYVILFTAFIWWLYSSSKKRNRMGVYDELERLHDLYREGVIDEIDYHLQKDKILKRKK